MGLFTDPNNNFTVYDVPKGGGTTVRSWIAFAGTGEYQLAGTDTYYHENPTAYKLLDEWGYKCVFFEKVAGDRICIKRDPVERFISCYKDKVIKEGRLPGVSIDDLLNDFEETISKNDQPHPSNKDVGYLWFHFAPQVRQLGTVYDYYTHVFDISEVGTKVKAYLEGKWDIVLPDLHCRNNKSSTIELTDTQVSKIKEIYCEDYQTGWF